jgi:hypothetical protein
MTRGVAQDGSGFDPSVADALVSEITAAGGTAAACYENLEDAAACGRVVEFALTRFGRLDVLVHNAGLVVFASLEETDPTVWDRMVAIGVDAPFHLARAAVPHMRRQNYGRIVLTSSGRAMRVEHCLPGLVAYSMAKMGRLPHGRSGGGAIRHGHPGERYLACRSDPRVAPESTRTGSRTRLARSRIPGVVGLRNIWCGAACGGRPFLGSVVGP